MTKAEKITRFVESIFDLYGFNKTDLFYYYDKEGKKIDIPLFINNKADERRLDLISKRIGLTKKEILTMDETAAVKYWKKYPFYGLFKKYVEQWSWHSKFIDRKPTAEELLINRIFGNGEGIRVKARYNDSDIKERLIKELKEIDVVLPGTNYENADITSLSYSTEEFISFPQCTDMIRSLIVMVENIQELFFKTLNDEISEEEKRELNFLVYSLTVVDVVTPNTILTYENILLYKDIYIEEGYSDFFEYAKILGVFGTYPWRCKEFFQNEELVQEFIYIFPQAKPAMREFAINVTKFCCIFDWKDIKTGEIIQQSQEIYVPKNRKETYGFGKYIKILKKLSGPTSKGGLRLPERNPFLLSDKTFHRMQTRAIARAGGNLNE